MIKNKYYPHGPWPTETASSHHTITVLICCTYSFSRLSLALPWTHHRHGHSMYAHVLSIPTPCWLPHVLIFLPPFSPTGCAPAPVGHSWEACPNQQGRLCRELEHPIYCGRSRQAFGYYVLVETIEFPPLHCKYFQGAIFYNTPEKKLP